MRDKHLFQFSSSTIAKAAMEEAKYHRSRIEYWERELAQSKERVKATASLTFREQHVTNGSRMEIVIDYGDLTAYARMQESHAKIEMHRQAAERFESEAQTYGSQDQRAYELDADDVHHFRLGGKAREE